MLVGKTRYLSYFRNLSRDLPPWHPRHPILSYMIVACHIWHATNTEKPNSIIILFIHFKEKINEKNIRSLYSWSLFEFALLFSCWCRGYNVILMYFVLSACVFSNNDILRRLFLVVKMKRCLVSLLILNFFQHFAIFNEIPRPTWRQILIIELIKKLKG